MVCRRQYPGVEGAAEHRGEHRKDGFIRISTRLRNPFGAGGTLRGKHRVLLCTVGRAAVGYRRRQDRQQIEVPGGDVGGVYRQHGRDGAGDDGAHQEDYDDPGQQVDGDGQHVDLLAYCRRNIAGYCCFAQRLLGWISPAS